MYKEKKEKVRDLSRPHVLKESEWGLINHAISALNRGQNEIYKKLLELDEKIEWLNVFVAKKGKQ